MEGGQRDVLVRRPEKITDTTQCKYFPRLMKRLIKLIFFLQVVKDVTDELELEEADDEADRKQEGPSEMDLKVLYTYRILHVVACLIGFVACIFRGLEGSVAVAVDVSPAHEQLYIARCEVRSA